MKKIYIHLLFILGVACKGQNLVPNGSFETHTACPHNYGQLDLSTGWSSPVFGATPDYLHQCGTLSYGVPANTFGVQHAKTGNSYCGLVLISNPTTTDYREYIEVRLTTPLTPNVCYQFEMFVSLGESYSRYTTDNWGVYFSNVAINNSSITSGPLPFIPQIANTVGNYPDTAGWSVSKGSFVATGGEEYMIIGNFKNGVPDTLIADSTIQWRESYVFIDDVSLISCATTRVLANTVSEDSGLFPNPFYSELKIQIQNRDFAEVVIYDLNSEVIISKRLQHGETLNTESLADGIYFYKLTQEKGAALYRKIIKR